jgi:hypothetical protein
MYAEEEASFWNWLFSSPTPLLANIGTEKKDYERGKEVDIVAVLADEERGGRSQLYQLKNKLPGLLASLFFLNSPVTIR